MGNWILFQASIKKHRSNIIGIFILSLIVAIFFNCAFIMAVNFNQTVTQEMQRLGFGTFTAWVNGKDTKALQAELNQIQAIEKTTEQKLIYADYEINQQVSSGEGQLIVYHGDSFTYRFLTPQLKDYQENIEIKPNEIYVSPALLSKFDFEIGDEIIFKLARGNGNRVFTIAGYFEDPFMGSSMIEMKGFLIAPTAYREMIAVLDDSGIDAMARAGSMLHLFQSDQVQMSHSELNKMLNEVEIFKESLSFLYSFDAINQFMLILQNVYIGILLTFIMVLFIVTLIIINHSISTSLELDVKNIAILKNMGVKSRNIQNIQIATFLCPILLAILLGLPMSIYLSQAMMRLTIYSTGLLIPHTFPILLGLSGNLLYLFIILLFLMRKTQRIKVISPLKLLNELKPAFKNNSFSRLHKKTLALDLAKRQLSCGFKRYLGIALISFLLVFILNLILSINRWLGPQGEGMMQAFNPADHDIGVQILNGVAEEDIEDIILKNTSIESSYRLAMPTVNVNGLDVTANVIDDPSLFQLLTGRTIQQSNEVVITEAIAKEFQIKINDQLLIGQNTQALFTVVGIYQCANEMGMNIGLSEEGYNTIGKVMPEMWCKHYFLADSSLNASIVHDLDTLFKGNIHLHENTWSGLKNIISAMKLLIVTMLIVMVLFILVVTALTANKLLYFERKDLGIYKTLGLHSNQLQQFFMLRFLLISFCGGLIGMLFSRMSTDSLVRLVLKEVGISNFYSFNTWMSMLVPIVFVSAVFSLCAYVCAGSIKRLKLNILMEDSD